MERRAVRGMICAWVLLLTGGLMALAQDGVNPRAQEELKAFIQKIEDGDALFGRKQYVEAAAALAASHALYQRAERRDDSARGYKILLKPGTFAALRRYGYGLGPNASLTETLSGAFEGTAAGLHSAALDMWQDAAILGNAEKGPLAGAFNDPPLVELSEEQLGSMISSLYGPVSTFKLPVPDTEWRNVVLWSRRAELIVEHALAKYPAWKTARQRWSRSNDNLSPTGDEALADIKKKLAEAEPEYQMIVARFKNAAPKRVVDTLQLDSDTLGDAVAGVNRNGWVVWSLARDALLSSDLLAARRKQLPPLYAEEGKMMPADALKPLEDKIAELKSACDTNASRWKFPAGKPQNAAIQTRAAQTVKGRIPGATVIKAALDDADWTIVKNDLGLPRKRTRAVLVLVRIPGQKWPWLTRGYYEQDYAGSGTYNPGGSFGLNEIRLQPAN